MNQSTTTIDGVTFLRANAAWIHLQLCQREKFDESPSIHFTTYEKDGFFHAYCHYNDRDDLYVIWFSQGKFATDELRADALRTLSQITGLLGVYQDVHYEDVWQYSHII